jgi:hypothetical protein
MSKELIEQLAKEHGQINTWPCANHEGSHYSVLFTSNQLEAFAKAYQAAAPIDNVAEALEKAIAIGKTFCLYGHQQRDLESQIRALIPDTQAKKGE